MEQPIAELVLYTYPWHGVGIGKNVTNYMGIMHDRRTTDCE